MQRTCLCPGISVPNDTNSGITSLYGVTGEQRKYTRNNTQFGNTCPGLLADTSRDLGYLGAVAPSVIGIRIYIREVSQLPSFIVTSVIKLGHCP